MRRPVLLLIVLSFLTFFLGLGRQAITDSDEGFYAEAAREMVVSGDWLTPHFNEQDRWQKPILYYWLTAATYLVTGPDEASARFWSALSGLGLVLLTATIARRYSADHTRGRPPQRVAWLAGAIVATSYGYATIARMALPDLPLAFCVTATIWSVLRGWDAETVTGDARRSPRHATRWWALAGLVAGLGFLMKGPVALVLPAIVLLPIWWLDRRTISLRFRDVLLSILVFAVVGLPWYVAMLARHGMPYFESFFIGDNLERFATSRFNEPRSLAFYVPIVLGGFIPWTAYLVALPIAPAWNALRGRRRISPGGWRLLLWALLPLAFYTLSTGKQPRYILPVLPPLAILLARLLDRRLSDAATAPVRCLSIATWATAAVLLSGAALLARAQPLFINSYASVTWLGVASLGVMAVVLGWTAATRAWSRLPVLLTTTGVVLLLTVQFGVLSGRRPEAVEQAAHVITERVRSERQTAPAGPAPTIGVYRVFARNLGFYTHMPRTDLSDDAQVIEFMRSPAPVLVVAMADDLDRIERTTDVPIRRLASMDYFNAANLRLGTLLHPNPAKDIDRVVVATNR